MPSYLLLLAPAANRVYAGEEPRIAAAELELCVPGAVDVRPERIADVDYLAFDADDLDPVAVGRCSAALALFRRDGGLLDPVAAPRGELLSDDLVTIPKYPGKTNEQFTRLLLNLTLASVDRPDGERRVVLDPLCGRGTTLSLAWLLGCDAAGVEADEKAVEAHAAFLKTYLRRKRLKHTAEVRPVRRDGRALGRRFDASLALPGHDPLRLTVFTGDARDSAALFGKRRFDAIVTDAPYGVAHGARTGAERDRSPATLLADAIPRWAEQLKKGGALGLSWNSLGLPRPALLGLLADAGLEPRTGGAWERFEHRVDSSIRRDLVVATRAR